MRHAVAAMACTRKGVSITFGTNEDESLKRSIHDIIAGASTLVNRLALSIPSCSQNQTVHQPRGADFAGNVDPIYRSGVSTGHGFDRNRRKAGGEKLRTQLGLEK